MQGSRNETHGPVARVGRTADAEGERRQVTALFYDIVESTSLLNRLGPEDMGPVQKRVHETAATVVRKFGGYVDLVRGDGGCAYFGIPLAAEDAAESAVAAGLELVDRLRPTSEAPMRDTPVRIRVGIATGLVVLNINEDASPATVSDIVGFAPTLAARVEAEALPNTVLVADSTYQLTHRAFHFEPVGARTLKGFTEPQALWRAETWLKSTDHPSCVDQPSSPLVSRAEELALCRTLWEEARRGSGRVVQLVGEAGIGKSRLVAALRSLVGGDGETRVFHCHPRANARPLHPILDALEGEYRTAPPGSAAEGLTLLFEGRGSGQKGGQRPPQVDLPPVEVRRRVLGAACDVVRGWAAARPQLLVLEDLHWADTLTRALVAELLREVGSLPLLLVLTTREAAPLEAGTVQVHSLHLSRLNAEAVGEMVKLAWAPRLPPLGLGQFVHERSEGVPLFAEELAQLLKVHLGAAQTHVHDWKALLSQRGVATLQDLLTARLAAVGRARRIAQIASVIGREFSCELLTRLAGEEISRALLNESLAKLLRAELIQRVDTPAGMTFRFRHVLIQEAAHDSLLKGRRRLMHRRIVDMLGAGLTGDIPHDLMAWHCEQAGLLVEAARFAILAAEDCAIRSAPLEAERLLTDAEAFLREAEAPPEVKQELTLRLLAIRGPVATALYGAGSVQARAIYEEGVAACKGQDRFKRESWFPLYWGWWFTAPDFEVQRERSRVIVGDLRSANDPEVRLQAFHCAWATHFNTGRHQDCLHHIADGLALYDRARAVTSRTRYGGHDAKVCALGERGLSQWFLAREEEAVLSLREALDWAEEIQHLGSLCHALDIAVMLQFYRRDLAEVLSLTRRMRAIADAHPLPSMDAKSKIFGGWAHALSGELENGLAELDGGIGLQRETGTEEDFPVYHEMQAELLGLADRPDEGLEVVNETIARARHSGHLFWLPELFRRRALLREQRGDDGEACLIDLDEARSLAEQQGAIALAARATREIARLQGGGPISQSVGA